MTIFEFICFCFFYFFVLFVIVEKEEFGTKIPSEFESERKTFFFLAV
jgi:hypothetical protein